MFQIHVQPRYSEDFSRLRWGIAASVVAAGMVVAVVAATPPFVHGVASVIAAIRPSVVLDTRGAATSASVESIRAAEMLLPLADDAGRWVTHARVAGTRHSAAVLDIGRDSLEVSLLGVRIHGLPAGATDLSLLVGASVIVSGHCSGGRTAACSIDNVLIVFINGDMPGGSARAPSGWRDAQTA